MKLSRRAHRHALRANPLNDIDAVTRNAGGVVGGGWFPGEVVTARLEAIAAKHAL